MARRIKDDLLRDALGFALLERRDELGLSQLQIANRCVSELSQSRIAHLESGDQSCTVDQLWALASALEVTPSELARRIESAYALLKDPDNRRLFWLGRARVRGTTLRR